MTTNHRLEALFRVFIATELQKLEDELYETERPEEAEEVHKMKNRLREICS